ncbi:ABC transporter ATP-binding protein [Ectobacillus antri]|jgi:putative ABC transport system ATP-binding protein|uniref:ABC transporter ATP-binding protein n=1 Tax=Ectobacillus antri TaxID=2486280 RepID=A0ABT6H7S0_9BACI|nr:ABC transporter ATP-binding protein [Ectobacillus antri]MDG4658339.1 ABC transporter ATP-binding protein [Ectobacillus antri]MDG5755384.1 ABC transporter ATP-binding protein [Ectobacillus antri]
MCIVKLNNVSKSFKKQSVLKDVSLEIPHGDMVAIVGASGKGKTTLLNIIGLISEKDSGEMFLCGASNPHINSKQAMLLRREQIGYLFQNYGLVDEETVFWNLKLALTYKRMTKQEKQNRIEHYLKEFNILNLKEKKVYQLSGGEQQRVALVRLMLQDSSLILADEPTGSLDTTNRDFVIEALKRLNMLGKTIIIVTHDPYIASQCQRVIEL